MPYADMALATIRHHHPEAQIIHMGHLDTPTPELADAAWHNTEFGESVERLIRAKCAMLADMGDEPTAILDADTLCCAPLGGVWKAPFDVALTKRVSALQPYNSGVMFSRKAAFWAGLLERMDSDPYYCSWGGDQEALALEAQSGKWQLLELSCSEWNNSEVNGAIFPKAKIVHYKGPRREWMCGHFERGLWK